MSKDILLFLTSSISEEDMIKQIRECLNEYQMNKSDENKTNLRTICMLFTGKEIVDRKGAEVVSKEIDQIYRIQERLNTQSQ